MNKTYKINGLNCANCANKIETELKTLNFLEDVNLNFNTEKLCFKVKKEDEFSQNKIQEIIDNIETGVNIFDQDIDFDTKPLKNENSLKVIKMAISLALFAFSFVVRDSPLINLGLLIAAYLVSGYTVLYRALKNILNGNFFDEFFLMSLATIGAFIIGEYSEGVGVMLFFQVGEFFQDLAVGKTRKSIKSLLEIKPDFARLLNGNILNPEDVLVDQILEVRPGEKIPLDGVIKTGSSAFETKTITGEPIPSNISEGGEVLSGYINLSDVVTIQVTSTFKESTISKILEMVQNEVGNKTETEKFITKFSKVYTPIVVFSALAIAILSPILIDTWSYSDSVYKALIFLVVSCPCALVLSVPLGYFGGLGRASKEGILIKGSSYLDGLTSVSKFVFDKTGTLTEGRFEVTNINLKNGISRDEFLTIAYNAESKSNHPIAKAIVKYSKNSDSVTYNSYKENGGKGVIANVDDDIIIAGTKEFLLENNVEINHKDSDYGTQVLIAKNRQYVGTITLSDQIKTNSKKLVETLGSDNIIMLTGDNKKSAAHVSKELGIKDFNYSMLPKDKADFVKSLKNKESVLFTGDGINDAPVLVASNIGVSMGGIGSDAAIESSDIVLMDDDPFKIVIAIRIAKFTKKIISQNIVITLGFKVLIMILGLTGVTGLWLAIFADVGVSLIAVVNSIRTLHNKIDG